MTSFLIRLYGLCVVQELMVIYPFYAVMFVDYGLSAMEISWLFTVWAGITLLLEVPSGVLADKYSRRFILSVAQLFSVAGFACWGLFPGFWGFFFGFVLWGTKSALSSGTFEALIYDELKRFGCEAQFVKVNGRSLAFNTTGVILSSFAAAALVDYGYQVLIGASVAVSVVASFMALLLPPAPPTQSTTPRPYFTVLGEGVRYAWRSPVILRLIAFASLAIALGGGLDEFYTIFANEAGLPRYALGIFLGSIYAVQAAAGFVAHRFEGLSLRWLYAAFLGGGALLTISAWWMGQWSVLLLGASGLVFQVIALIVEGRLQHMIPSEIRATVSSVRGFSAESFGIGLFIGMGLIVGEGSYRPGFLTFGVLGLVIGLCYLLFGRKE